MKISRVILLAAAAAIGTTGVAQAQSNLDKMRNVQATGTSYAPDFIDQKGPRAEQIKKNLERVEMPAGFSISLYAIVPDARHIAVGPQGTVLWVGTRKVSVYSVVDRDKDRVADEVEAFAPPIGFTVPNGPCISRDGFLYLVEANRVLVFPAAEFFFENPDVAVDVVVPEGELIPPEEVSFNHGARVCRIGPDNKLYIALGQPYNVPPAAKADLYRKWGIGGIIRMNRDGSGREVYTYGVRNSVGFDFNPANGELWFTDNQVDGMGDDIPPGELNRQTAPGQHFGGMTFYTGKMFPAKYRGGIFYAQHGSWNRTTPIGARVMFTAVNEDGSAGETMAFAEGWLDDDTGEYYGRPVDVAQLADGSILVTDDYAGAVYRIAYGQ
jgi:glucose/arabinose dehydrogenase